MQRVTVSAGVLRVRRAPCARTGCRPGIPEKVPKDCGTNLDGPFLVFRDKVQEDLKLTEEQKEKLEEHLRELLPDAMQFFQKHRRPEAGGARERTQSIPPEGAGETGSGAEGNPQRRPAQALHQLELQREGAFALWHGDPRSRKT